MVCVVLVNYNGREYNRTCINSILKSGVEEKRIVVVDNASTDGSLEELEREYADNESVHIIRLSENFGFSRGNNEGIKWALAQRCQYIMLLNNDTEIAPRTIEKMIELQRRTGHIVVPKILYAGQKDRIWCAGGELSRFLRKPRHRGAGETDRGQFDREDRCTFANGCCMLLTDKIVERLGLLDERFFLYYEDTEYSMRAHKKGVGISYCGGAVVYHKVNGSTGGNENPANAYYITRNWLMCNRMYMKARFVFFGCYFLLNRTCWALIWLLMRKPNMVNAMRQGIRDFRSGRYGKYDVAQKGGKRFPEKRGKCGGGND